MDPIDEGSGKGCCCGHQDSQEAGHSGGDGHPGRMEGMKMGRGGMRAMPDMMSEGGATPSDTIRDSTPELRGLFNDWLTSLGDKALSALNEGEKDAAALAAAMGTSEEAARYVLVQLAAKGRIFLIGKRKSDERNQSPPGDVLQAT
ncbi:MAG: hypothetical protein WBX25_13540 [Rhodomicrobium sp.]